MEKQNVIISGASNTNEPQFYKNKTLIIQLLIKKCISNTSDRKTATEEVKS